MTAVPIRKLSIPRLPCEPRVIGIFPSDLPGAPIDRFALKLGLRLDGFELDTLRVIIQDDPTVDEAEMENHAVLIA